jgi:hypothetical protein
MKAPDKASDDLTASERWVEELWAKIATQAASHSGDVVVRLLREASSEVWDAGLDAAFEQMEADDLIEKAPAFDITWLSILLLKIAKEPERKTLKQLRKEWKR